MANVLSSTDQGWTAADLVARFGPIPLRRVLLDPEPGTATEDDLLDAVERKGRLCELVDGTLVEKAMGWYEAYLAVALARLLGDCVDANRLGIVIGADGLTRLAPGLVRIPDVAFFSWDRLPKGDLTEVHIAPQAPDLAVEILSVGNTAEEITQKIHEYFHAGVKLVWIVEPELRTVRVYRTHDSTLLDRDETLDGGNVLSGLRISLAEFFTPPERPAR